MTREPEPASLDVREFEWDIKVRLITMADFDAIV
jgi:hypothetical protein